MANQPVGETGTTLGHVLSSHPWLYAMAPALTQALRDILTMLSPQGRLPPDVAQLKDQIEGMFR